MSEIKCAEKKIRHGLRDLSISEEDYLVLDRSARERLKHKSEEEKKKSCEYPLENELNSYATSVPQEAAKENETQTFLCRCLRGWVPRRLSH